MNVTAMPLNSTHIKVSWGRVPKNKTNGVVESYKLSYQEILKNGGQPSEIVVNTSLHSLVLGNLMIFKRYQISVSAKTAALGYGKPSQVEARTKAGGEWRVRSSLSIFFVN